jgi:predicted transcriptional regulator YheO
MANKLSRYISIADALAKLFHPHAEVVIHDIEDDAIFYIANPYSGREKGDPSNLKINAQDFNLDEDVIGPYEKFGARGQRIRSITSVLKDDKANPKGLMCINLDFSILESSLSIVKEFFHPANVESRPEILFRNEWLEVIQLAIRSYLKEQAQTLESLDVQARKALLAHLDEKGLFYARKSAEQVAVHLGISRATIYKDLSEIRKKKREASDILAGL